MHVKKDQGAIPAGGSRSSSEARSHDGLTPRDGDALRGGDALRDGADLRHTGPVHGGMTDQGTEPGQDASATRVHPPGESEAAGDLLAALRAVGLDEPAAAAFCDAALVMGAVAQGRPVASVRLRHQSASAALADELGRRPRADASPGSMESHLHDADVALTAAEAITSTTTRLEAALLVATQEQTVSVGAALLRQRDVAEPGELSRTARERWRARAKRRTREELGPAIGWTAGETVHLVGVANAPLSFSLPVISQMARGQLPWRLARSLWRACEGLTPEDAAHLATALCADDPQTCVPERLGPDGEVVDGPWDHRAFYLALAREVAKVTGADDADPDDAALARARRDAAYASRRVFASVDEDGTGSLTLITSALWAAGIKDRLSRAARAARAAGDARTLDQLQSDIARALWATPPSDTPTSPTRTSPAPGPRVLTSRPWISRTTPRAQTRRAAVRPRTSLTTPRAQTRGATARPPRCRTRSHLSRTSREQAGPRSWCRP